MTAATCGWVTMSMRELDRLKVIEAIIEGRLKPAAAAQRLRLTTRGRPSRPNISSTWSAE